MPSRACVCVYVTYSVLAESPSLWIAEGRFLEDMESHRGRLAARVFLGCGTRCVSNRHTHTHTQTSHTHTHTDMYICVHPCFVFYILTFTFILEFALEEDYLALFIAAREFDSCVVPVYREYSATRDHARPDVDKLLLNYCTEAARILDEKGCRPGQVSSLSLSHTHTCTHTDPLTHTRARIQMCLRPP